MGIYFQDFPQCFGELQNLINVKFKQISGHRKNKYSQISFFFLLYKEKNKFRVENVNLEEDKNVLSHDVLRVLE